VKPSHPPSSPASTRRLRRPLFAALICLLLDLAAMDAAALQHKPQPPNWLLVSLLSLSAMALVVALHATRHRWATLRRLCSAASIIAATIHLASVIAAPRETPQRAEFAQKWTHFLNGDPELNIYFSNRERLQSAFRAIVFAFNLRTRPVRDVAWCPVDWILITNKRLYSLIAIVDTSMVLYFWTEYKFADILMHAPHSLLIGSGSLWALAHYLRRNRGVALMTHRRKPRD
jgi:hypothetical protein